MSAGIALSASLSTRVNASLPSLPTSQCHTLLPKADRKSTRLNSSHSQISYAVFCLTEKLLRSDVAGHVRPEDLIAHLQPQLRLYLSVVRGRHIEHRRQQDLDQPARDAARVHSGRLL